MEIAHVHEEARNGNVQAAKRGGFLRDRRRFGEVSVLPRLLDPAQDRSCFGIPPFLLVQRVSGCDSDQLCVAGTLQQQLACLCLKRGVLRVFEQEQKGERTSLSTASSPGRVQEGAGGG